VAVLLLAAAGGWLMHVGKGIAYGSMVGLPGRERDLVEFRAGRGQHADGRVQSAAPEPEMLGKPAPEFRLKDVDGRETTLASLRGKTVLLDFWATWCAPCRGSMPDVQTLSDQFQAQGLVVLGIDTNESAELAREYFAEQKFSFANLLGSGSDVMKDYGANGIPRVVLIDKDGVVRYAHTGWGSGMDLTAEVKKLVER
jgi:peroxiredoxin